MVKLSMGQYLANSLESHGKVVKVGYNAYFNTDGLAEAAKCLDRMLAKRAAFDEKPSKLETVGLEILMSLAGYESSEDFAKAYDKYVANLEL